MRLCTYVTTQHTYTHTHDLPQLHYSMATEHTALLGKPTSHNYSTVPDEAINLRSTNSLLNSNIQDVSYNETSVFSQGTDTLTGASNTVDIRDLLVTLERASAIVKAHIDQQDSGANSARRRCVRLLLILHCYTNSLSGYSSPAPPSPSNLSPFHRAKPLIPHWITSYLIVITFIWQVSCISWNLHAVNVILELGISPSLPPSPPSSRLSVLVSWRSYSLLEQ